MHRKRRGRNIAPNVGGVDTSDGTHIAADRKIAGGPSVLYDAVAIRICAAQFVTACRKLRLWAREQVVIT